MERRWGKVGMYLGWLALGAQVGYCWWGMSEQRLNKDSDEDTSIVNDGQVELGLLWTESTWCGRVCGRDKVVPVFWWCRGEPQNIKIERSKYDTTGSSL